MTATEPTNHRAPTAPNAFHKLKQAFKGILKNSGKNRQDQQAPPPPPPQKQDEQQQQQQQPADKPQVPPKPEQQAASAAPVLPPTALVAETSRPGSGSAGKEQPPSKAGDTSPVSPAEPTSSTPQDNSNSDPVSAISADQDKPLPLPKTDGAADEAKAAAGTCTSHARQSQTTQLTPSQLP